MGKKIWSSNRTRYLDEITGEWVESLYVKITRVIGAAILAVVLWVGSLGNKIIKVIGIGAAILAVIFMLGFVNRDLFQGENAQTTQTHNQPNHITVPNGTIHIRNGEFANRGAASIYIPRSVTTIGANAFANNQLTSITIPNSVREIGINAFAGNPIIEIVIGANVRLGFEGIVGVLGSGTRFNTAYDDARRLAGTYTRRDVNSTTWSRNGQVIHRQTATTSPAASAPPVMVITTQRQPAQPPSQTTAPSPAAPAPPVRQAAAQRLQPPSNIRHDTPGTDNVTIRWNSTGLGITYRVYRNRHQNNFSQATYFGTTQNNSMRVTGLNPGTNYYFWVVSRQGNQSTRPQVISVRTAPRGVR